MQNQDYLRLLSPGKHSCSLDDIEQFAVVPFPLSSNRTRLFMHLRAWVEKLRSLGVTAILWIDGSFVTEKPEPNDIDCVMWYPQTNLPLTAELQSQIQALFERSHLRTTYGLDFYLAIPSDVERFHDEAYWKGLFGFQRDGATAKGFVEILI